MGNSVQRRNRRCILFFVKYPDAGAVKTRLAADIGKEPARMLYRAFVSDMLCTLRRVDADLQVFYHGGRPAEISDWIGGSLPVWPQKGNSLGERMLHAFYTAKKGGYSRILLVGSDIPGLRASIAEDAFSALESHCAVIGPATDGGYYLIGFRSKRIVRSAFEKIPWSTPRVLEQTLDRLENASCSVRLLPAACDIDTHADLLKAAAAIGAEPDEGPGPGTAETGRLASTRQALKAMGML